MSRRKQLKPIKLNMEGSVQKRGISPFLQESLEEICAEVKLPLEKGRLLGPFRVKSPPKNDSTGEGGGTKSEHLCGRERLAQFDELPYQLLKRLSIVDSGDKDQNCILDYKDGFVTLEVVKTVERLDQLVAVMRRCPPGLIQRSICLRSSPDTKSVIKHSRPTVPKIFSCDRCQTKFSDRNTLEAHQTYYCQKKRKFSSINGKSEHRAKSFKMERTSSNLSATQISPASLPSLSLMKELQSEVNSRHKVIYLPCAFIDSNIMAPRILGEPQTIIPVAVPLGFVNPSSNCLSVYSEWSEGLDVRKKVELNVTQGRRDSDVDVSNSPLDLSITGGPEKSQAEDKRSPEPSEVPKKIRIVSTKTSERSPVGSPDFTLTRGESVIRSPHSHKITSHSSLSDLCQRKRHVCPDCDVKFTSLETLEGHMKFYCSKQSAIDSTENSGRKLSSCHTCEYASLPVTHHSPIIQQNLFCSVCGYRGYSHRGMKSHLRSHDSSLEAKVVQSDKVIRSVKSELRDSISSSEGSENSSTDSSAEASEPTEKLESAGDKTSGFHYLPTPDGMRFACGFCSYLSPYKGNVRRHLNLVHKERQTEKAAANDSSGEESG